MKTFNHILVFLFLSFAFTACAQDKKGKAVSSEINDKDFATFLNLFYDVQFPLNYTKEIARVKTLKIGLKEIELNSAREYLQMNDDELYNKIESYDYDTDQRLIRKEENLPSAHFKHLASNYILACYRAVKADDTLSVYLCTFNSQGKLIDKELIGGHFTRERDWISCVIVNDSEFKVFYYTLNIDNYIMKNNTIQGVRDKSLPLTIVVIKSFQIDTSGKIGQIGEVLEMNLNLELSAYKEQNATSDDPINQF